MFCTESWYYFCCLIPSTIAGCPVLGRSNPKQDCCLAARCWTNHCSFWSPGCRRQMWIPLEIRPDLNVSMEKCVIACTRVCVQTLPCVQLQDFSHWNWCEIITLKQSIEYLGIILILNYGLTSLRGWKAWKIMHLPPKKKKKKVLHSASGPPWVRFLQISLVAETCHLLHPSPVCREAVPTGKPPPAACLGWQSPSDDTALRCCGTAGRITQLTSIKTNRAALLEAVCVFLELCIGKDSLSHPPRLHIPLHLSINSQKPLEPARKASCLCSPMQISLLPIY